MRTLIGLVMFAVAVLAPAATLYKTVTPDGQVVYTDQPPESGKADKTLNFTAPPPAPVPESVIRYNEELEKSAKKRLAEPAKGKEPVLFWAKWCPYCRAAEAYLNEKKISFVKRDVDTPEGKQGLRDAGGKGIPVLLINGRKIDGFSRLTYDAIFGSR